MRSRLANTITGGLVLWLAWVVPSPLWGSSLTDQDAAMGFYRQMVDRIAAREFDEVESATSERLNAAMNEGDPLMQSAALAVFGELETGRERFVAAVDHLVSCRELFVTGFQDMCTMRLAEVYWRLGQLAVAAELLVELAQRYGEADDFAGQASIWNNLGIIHADSGDSEQAERWFRMALNAYTDLGDRQLEALSLGNLAKLVREQGNLDQARDLIDQALAIADELAQPMNLAQQFHVSGSIHADSGELERAQTDFQRALELSQRDGQRGEMATTKTELARILLLQGQTGEALTLLREALDVVSELGLLRYQIDIHRLLRRVYLDQEDFQSSLEHAEREIEGAQTLAGQEMTRELARMSAIYRIDEAERRLELAAAEAELAEARLQRQRSLLAALVVFIALTGGIMALLIVRVRERGRFERQAFARERQFKQDFSAMLVHDLRGPLQGIMISAEQIQDQDENPHLRKLGDQILAACDTMVGLINDLLRFSKSESQRLVLSVKPVEFASIIEQAVSGVATLASGKGIGFDIQLDSMASLPIDEDRLRQVVSNLLGNAIRHSPTGGQIKLRLTRNTDQPEARQCMTIDDQGPGIREKDLEHIFRPYFRSAAITNQPDGFGLGLAISKLIVRAHGGEISALNLDPTGARFEVCLPEPRAA